MILYPVQKIYLYTCLLLSYTLKCQGEEIPYVVSPFVNFALIVTNEYDKSSTYEDNFTC